MTYNDKMWHGRGPFLGAQPSCQYAFHYHWVTLIQNLYVSVSVGVVAFVWA